ncbi:hypothetical protein BGZ94_002491 [Podila epigama]|nr:hypothetical protein BGZ94_002491 [Podila epigama]
MSSVPIFDIVEIFEAIGDNLSRSDIRACRLVCRQWSSILRPHLWKQVRLLTPTILCEDRLLVIGRNASKIRSLDASVSLLGKLTEFRFCNLKRLAIHGDSHNEFTPLSAIMAVIEQGQRLKSLEIDINYLYYFVDQPQRLGPLLLLAITRLPSLTRLVWKIPDYYTSHEFVRAILYVCLSRAIKVLQIGSLRLRSSCKQCWNLDDDLISIFNVDHLDAFEDSTPHFKELQHHLRVSTPFKALGPFQLEQLVVHQPFEGVADEVVENCPNLIEISMDCYSDTVMEVLTSKQQPSITGIDLRPFQGFHVIDKVPQFAQLQKVYLPTLGSKPFEEVVSQLETTSLTTLEVIGIPLWLSSLNGVIRFLRTFPRLREVDMGSVKITVGAAIGKDSFEGWLPSYTQNLKEFGSLENVVENWDGMYLKGYYGNNMRDWWIEWDHARYFVKALGRFYGPLKDEEWFNPIHVQYVSPVRPFLSCSELHEYMRPGSKPMTVQNASSLSKYWERHIQRMDDNDSDDASQESEEEEPEFGSEIEDLDDGLELEQVYEVYKSRRRDQLQRSRKHAAKKIGRGAT